MNTPTIFRLRHGLTGAGLSLLLLATASLAQVPITAASTAGIDASGNFQHERTSCLSGRTQQDVITCLREASSAADAKRVGKLDNPVGAYATNARQRCDIHSGEFRAACEARVMGYGSTEGSVAKGGVLREVETVVIPQGETSTSVRIDAQTPAPVLLVPLTK
jgi:hypothetical protein